MSDHAERQRLDKWLWAARFFKTRSLANAAVDGGKVKLDGQPVKPARDVKPGDELEISIGDQRWTVVVRGLNELDRLVLREAFKQAKKLQGRLQLEYRL